MNEQSRDSLEERIRARAFVLYCARSEDAATAMDDWLAAEREITQSRSTTEGHAQAVLDSLDRSEAIR